MKKSLLIAVAALFVAIGANAQVKWQRTMNVKQNGIPQATKVMTPKVAKMEIMKASNTDLVRHDGLTNVNTSRRAVADIEGTYILDYGNWDGDFTTSSSFTITAETGTAKVIGSDEEGNETEEDFEYNIRLDDFTFAGGVAYGYYDEENATILIPVQTIVSSYSTYGRIVFAGLVTQDGTPYNFGFDLVFEVDSEGNLINYDFEEELAAAGWPEGCAITGFYDYLADYGTGMSYVELGTSLDVLVPNALMGATEVHIQSGSWGEWGRATYPICVEDYGTELLVHNFLGLCPISINVSGDKAGIATPVRAEDYNYGSDEAPDYIQIWQWDENFENIINPGEITGNITVEDGLKYIEFYDTEYKEAWTDEQGDHEAGNYIITDYTKWFMVHSTWGDTGAYWWGEARNVYLVMADDASGISNVKVTPNTNDAIYNLAGQRVDNKYKGIVIKNGNKMIQK